MKKTSNRSGYTLLFSIIVASLVLAVAAFILSISRKQFILVSASRDSNAAIYAADSGIECALEYYSQQANYFSTTTQTPGACGSFSWTAYPNISGPAIASPFGGQSASATSTFFMPIFSQPDPANPVPPPAGSPCVRVDVGYNVDSTNDSLVIIESRGYNIGWNPSGINAGDCSIPGPRKVERALRLRYGN